jgi:Fe2+ or Zn2+ uptake regulation protein
MGENGLGPTSVSVQRQLLTKGREVKWLKVLQCAGKNYRITRQRQAVLDALQMPGSVPDAGWVLEQVRKDVPNISLGTVHRTMNLLRQAGLVSRSSSSVGMRRADRRISVDCHATCIRCGSSVDVKIDAHDDLPNLAASATGFRIAGQRLDFYGLCPDCIQRESQG